MKNIVLLSLAFVTVLASPVVALLAQGAPKQGEVALLVALPWGPPVDDILIQTDLQEVHPDRAPFGAFVIFPSDVPDTPMPDTIVNGRWIILHGAAILELC